MNENLKKYFAEMLGTFVLVLCGVGSAVLAAGVSPGGIGLLGVSLAFGFSLFVMASAIGPISGCHINPAVTAAFAYLKRITWKDAAMYICFQIIGAIIAALVILVIAKGGPNGYDASVKGLGSNGYGDLSPGGYGLVAAAIAEIVFSMLFIFTILRVTSKKALAGFAAWPIGAVLALVHLVSIPITNTSVNPARSIGPALLAGGDHIAQLWLFVLAPLAGAVLAAAAHRALSAQDDL